MEQITGLAWMTGHADDQPRIQRGPCDPNGGLHAAFATLVGLDRPRPAPVSAAWSRPRCSRPRSTSPPSPSSSGPRTATASVAKPAGAPPADLNELAAVVWPRGASRDSSGAMLLAGVDVRDLAGAHRTPLMVVDEADFRSRCQDFADAFGTAGAVHYAGKAFLCSEVVRWLDDEGLSLDVCTGGELALALRAGFPAERIALHGSNKSDAELATGRARRASAPSSSIRSTRSPGSPSITDGRDDAVDVLIRVTVGVEAHTHEFIATAHEDQKFGFSLAGGDAAEAIRRVVACPRPAAGRPALAHRLADLRPVRLRGRPRTGWSGCSRRSCAGTTPSSSTP